MSTSTSPSTTDALACSVGARASELGVRIAVSESLTGGQMCAALAKAPAASTWFAGGVVAYGRDIKHGLLGVPSGPVVGAEAALAMAAAASRLLDAEYAIALTGVGGPDPQDGRTPGTVFLGVATPTRARQRELRVPGHAAEVCRESVRAALAQLDRELAEAIDAQLAHERFGVSPSDGPADSRSVRVGSAGVGPVP